MTVLLEAPQQRGPIFDDDGKAEFHADAQFIRDVLSSDDAQALSNRKGLKVPNAAPKASAGDVVLKGYANTWVMDRDFEFISRHAFDDSLDDYLRLNPILLWAHNHDWPLGQAIDMVTDDFGLATEDYIRKPQERDPDWKHGVFNDVVAGILRTLSIGGYFYRTIIDGEVLVERVELFEHSVVSVPSNPLSIFDAALKAIKGVGRSSVGQSDLVNHLLQLLGVVDITDGRLYTMSPDQRRVEYYNLAAQAAHDGLTAPDYNSWRNLTARIEQAEKAATTKGVDPKVDDLVGEAERLLDGLTSKTNHLRLGGEAGAKAGRVLSKANESKLRAAASALKDAADNITQVLDKVTEDEDPFADDLSALAAGDVSTMTLAMLTNYASHGMTESGGIGVPDLTLGWAAADAPWHAEGAAQRVAKHPAHDTSTGWLYSHGNVKRLLVADVEKQEGALVYVPRGVQAAALAINDMTDHPLQPTLKAAVNVLYDEMRKATGDNTLTTPWA